MEKDMLSTPLPARGKKQTVPRPVTSPTRSPNLAPHRPTASEQPQWRSAISVTNMAIALIYIPFHVSLLDAFVQSSLPSESMALRIKALNNDTSYFLTFIPSITPRDQKFPDTFPGAFTILIDPWLSGSAQIIGPKFSSQEHAGPACIASLDELPEPDMILISQAQPDHCHEETLCKLSPHVQSMIVAAPQAAKKILGWKHFDVGNIHSLQKYKRRNKGTVFRVEIPPPSPTGTSGELTISLLAPKRDFSTGLHNAIGITYRAPTSVLSLSLAAVPSPPTSPAAQIEFLTRLGTKATSSFAGHETTISVLYSPHGVAYSAIEPWATNLLSSPPVALLHPTSVVDVPWYFGGNMSTGCPGGLEITRNLLPTVWIAAHEEEKIVGGFATNKIWKKRYDIVKVQEELWQELEKRKGESRRPEIMRLKSGETIRVDERSVDRIVVEKAQVAPEAKGGEHGELKDEKIEAKEEKSEQVKESVSHK